MIKNLRIVLILLSTICLCLLFAWGRKVPVTCRIAVIGEGFSLEKLTEALQHMGERPEILALDKKIDLSSVDLLIAAAGTFNENTQGFKQAQPAVESFVRGGGSLLVFGLRSDGFRPEFLPHEIRFAADDPSGWGNYDFSDKIAIPSHALFNNPHRLEYLGGLQETDRIVYTAPEWIVLLGKDPGHPESDHTITKPDFTVGSIFESGWGNGRVLVCQPIIERYYAEKLQMVPHPLEEGILLFENLVEYMKKVAADRVLPLAGAQVSPTCGAAGATYFFHALADSTKGQLTVSWDFADGSYGEGANCEHIYSNDGVYLAAATVTDRSGATDRATCRVEVGPARPMRWAEYLIEAFTTRYYPDGGRVGVNYRTALVLNGMLDVYQRNRDPELLAYIEKFYNDRLISRWDNRPFKGDMQPDHNFVDVYSMAPPALELYRITGKTEYLTVATELWDHSLAVDAQLPPDGLWSPWGWHGRQAIVDFTYFKAHLRAIAWEQTGSTELLDNAAEQMVRFADVFTDPEDNLFFMAVDRDMKAYFTSPDRPSGLNDSKWSRANGWVSLALAELLTRLPKNHHLYDNLVKITRNFADGLASSQDPETGLWALVVDKPDYPGMWFETTATSMFVYSICRLVEARVLPADPYLAMARRGYNGLQQNIGIGAFGYPYISNACQGTLPRPNIERWLACHRHDNDLHVLGPFMMAEEALWRVAPPDLAVIGNLRSGASGLGRVLNRSGNYFYQIPNLYTEKSLDEFGTLIIDSGAMDANTADVRAYYDKLLERADSGATVLILRQTDTKLLQKMLAGLEFPENEEGKPRVADGGAWEMLNLGDNSVIYSMNKGTGRIIYRASGNDESLAHLLAISTQSRTAIHDISPSGHK
jgi:rhamnogalacturonyl hydrolase YesR